KVPSAAYGGRYGAVHGIDVPYSMYDIRFPLAGPTVENRKLAEQLAGAWVSFSATGNPNSKHLPEWPRYETGSRSTLVFADSTTIQNDPRKAFREYWAAQDPGQRII